MGVACNKGELPASPSRQEAGAPPTSRDNPPVSKEDLMLTREESAVTSDVSEVKNVLIETSGASLVGKDVSVLVTEELTGIISEVSTVLSVSDTGCDESETASSMSPVISDGATEVGIESTALSEQSASSTNHMKKGEVMREINSSEENYKDNKIIPDLEHAQRDVTGEEQEVDGEDDSDYGEQSNDNVQEDREIIPEDNSPQVTTKRKCQNNTDKHGTENTEIGNTGQELSIQTKNENKEGDNNTDKDGELERVEEESDDESTLKDDDQVGNNKTAKKTKRRKEMNDDDDDDDEEEEEEEAENTDGTINVSTEKEEDDGIEWVLRVKDRDSLKCLYVVLEIRSATPLTLQHLDLARTRLRRLWWWWSLGVRARGQERQPWLCVLPPTSAHTQCLNDDDDEDDDDDDDDDDEDENDDDSDMIREWWEVVEQQEWQRKSHNGGHLCSLTRLRTPSRTQASVAAPSNSTRDDSGLVSNGACDTIDTTTTSTENNKASANSDRKNTNAAPNNSCNITDDIANGNLVTNSDGNTGDAATTNGGIGSSSGSAGAAPTTDDGGTSNMSTGPAVPGDGGRVAGTCWHHITHLLLAFPQIFLNSVSQEDVCQELLAILDLVMVESRSQKTIERQGQTGEGQEAAVRQEQAVEGQEQAGERLDTTGRQDQAVEGQEQAEERQETTERQEQAVKGLEQAEKVEGEETTGRQEEQAGESQETTKRQEQALEGQEQAVKIEGQETTGRQEEQAGESQERTERQEQAEKDQKPSKESKRLVGKEQLAWLESVGLVVSEVEADETQGSSRSQATSNNNNCRDNNEEEIQGYLQKTADNIISRNFMNKCKTERISHVSGFMTCVSIAASTLLEDMSEGGEHRPVVTRQRVWVQREWPSQPYEWHDAEEKPRRRQPSKKPSICLQVPTRQDPAMFWEAAKMVHKQYWDMPPVESRGVEWIHLAQTTEENPEQFHPPRFPCADFRLVGVSGGRSEGPPAKWGGKCLALVTRHTLTPVKHFLFTHTVNLQVREDTQVLHFTIRNSPLLPASITRHFADEIVSSLTRCLAHR